MSWQCKKCGQIFKGDKIPDKCPNFTCDNKNIGMWTYVKDNPQFSPFEPNDDNTNGGYEDFVYDTSQPEYNRRRKKKLFLGNSESVPEYVAPQPSNNPRRKKKLFPGNSASVPEYVAPQPSNNSRREEKLFPGNSASVPKYEAPQLSNNPRREEKLFPGNSASDPAKVALKQAAADYHRAKALYSGNTAEEISSAKTWFLYLGNYKDSAIMAVKCDQKLTKLKLKDENKIYQLAKTHYKSKNSVEHLSEAKRLWESIPGYKDSARLAEKCADRINKLINPISYTGVVVAIILILLLLSVAVASLLLFDVLPAGAAVDTSKAEGTLTVQPLIETTEKQAKGFTEEPAEEETGKYQNVQERLDTIFK